MSMTSYMEKVRKGLTGPESEFPVCLPTTFEQLSPHTLRDETYLAYIGYVMVDGTSGVHKRVKNQCMTSALDMIAIDVGLDGWKDIGFENVDNERSFCQIIRRLIRQNYGIILDIDAPFDTDPDDSSATVVWCPEDDPHAAAVVPLTECGTLVRLQSSWLPSGLQAPMRIEDVYEHIIHSTDTRWAGFPFHDANITFFPLVS